MTFADSFVFFIPGIVSLIPWFSFEKKKQEKMFKLSSASFFIMGKKNFFYATPIVETETLFSNYSDF
jgi:hypothetical protein